MSITIIKEPPSFYAMECERCDCVFTYTRDDLIRCFTSDLVVCPCCHEEIPHRERKRYTEEQK